MRTTLILLSFVLFTGILQAQFNYEPSAEHTYGLPNPDAPQQLLDFAPLIGECDCKSVSRKPDQTWADPVDMVWRFKYIMNGMAVQDETLKSDGKHAGSIRQFIADSTRWYVHYYNSAAPTTVLPVWEGVKHEAGKIILYREQTAPNGMEGFYRLTFSDMSETGFKWVGEWVNTDESIVFPTWKIDCTKRTGPNDTAEREKLMQGVRAFSRAYMDGNYDAIADAYTTDGKIFPNNAPIIEGREAIKKRWIIPEGSKILHHEINPDEIRFLGDYAYDYGTYNGKTLTKGEKEISWKGKYVVVWKKVGEDWKMYLDIWNRIAD
ncbi:MAG: nuclear transport factor 2 family protein [Bacteroidota bacterium]